MEIKKEQLLKGIKALKAVVCKQNKNDHELFKTVDKLSLQFSLIKIFPGKEKILKIELPHKVNSTGICLFVADVNRNSRHYEETTESYNKLLQQHNVTQQIDVIPLKRVKLEHNDYERKRNLSNFYDVFLCDARIIRLMPEILGKHFVGRKKFLIQVCVDKGDLNGEIERALRTTTCAIKNRGATSLVTFGDMVMSDEQLVENLEKVLTQVVGEVRGGWGNLRSLVVKGEQSLAIPIYQSKAPKDSIMIEDKIEKRGENKDGLIAGRDVGKDGVIKRIKLAGVRGRVDVERAEEVSTVRNAKILVTAAGDVVVIENKKGVVDADAEEDDDDDYESEEEEMKEEEEEEEDIDFEKNGTKKKRVIKENTTKSLKRIKLDSKDPAKKMKESKIKKQTALLKKETAKEALKPKVKKVVIKRNKKDLTSSGVKLVNYNSNHKNNLKTNVKKGSKKALKRNSLRLKSLKKKVKSAKKDQ